MNDPEISLIPFGMFELDAAGTVIHYSPAERLANVQVGIVGRSFFDYLAAIGEGEELKSRFLHFMADGTSVERFTISFPYQQESLKVQIVMAHISEKSEQGRERFALLRVMPEACPPASSLVIA